MTKPLKNMGTGTSVRTKLLQLAKQRGDDFQLVLLRYVNERLLYRLAILCDYASLMANDGEFESAIAIYDRLLSLPKVSAETCKEALWAVQKDNSGVSVDVARSRRFLKRALPQGRNDPAIFYNAACVAIELHDETAAIRHLRDAIQYEYEDIDSMLNDAMFTALQTKPEFKALLESIKRPR